MYKNVYIMPIDLGVRYEIILCIQDDIIHLHSTPIPSSVCIHLLYM